LPPTAGKLAFFRTETPARVSHPAVAGLTFAERVSYQRAIEEVYWRHSIWPKERPDHKPSLDEVMSRAQLEKKVEDYLRNSQALDDYWQQPLTADQLQAEMERMARRTKQPEVLYELFEALGNDPYVIAECLARPVLSERLITNFYAHDQRFHGDLKRRAEAYLQTHHSVEQMKQTSGRYTEIELARSDSEGIVGQASRLPEEQSPGGAPSVQSQDSTTSLKLNSRDWQESIEKLATQFDTSRGREAAALGVRRYSAAFESANMSTHSKGTTQQYRNIPVGVVSSLQEDESRYYATTVVKKTKDRLKLATVEWRKEPLESWRARTENQVPKVVAAASANYTRPTISDSDAVNGCTDDTWTATNHPPIARSNHTAVWTGSEMIVWGGTNGPGSDLKTGGKYNPSTDSWAITSTTSAPSARRWHTAVWTGSEMIIWGGYDDNTPYLNTGGRYNPSTNTWITTTTTNAPTARIYHTAVWTGSEMIVWGGYGGLGGLNTGGRYNPGTDSWTATSTAHAPSGRQWHATVWTGSEMIVWSGTNSFGYANSGGRYNPGTNSWTATSTTNAPSARRLHTAVWTGSEMIVWGGDDNSGYTNTGGGYNPATNSWTATNTTNAPSVRDSHTAVWTGNEMIVWGDLWVATINLTPAGNTILARIVGRLRAPLTRHPHGTLTRRSGPVMR
jgi:N-acetylneuraminic acid mutarotase